MPKKFPVEFPRDVVAAARKSELCDVFAIIPLIRMLARHKNGWVVLACGAALTAAGIGVVFTGISARQPAIPRIGFLILLAVRG